VLSIYQHAFTFWQHPGIEPEIFRTQVGHSNHYSTTSTPTQNVWPRSRPVSTAALGLSKQVGLLSRPTSIRKWWLSALEVFLKWYALYKFTFYLLTYLLTKYMKQTTYIALWETWAASRQLRSELSRRITQQPLRHRRSGTRRQLPPRSSSFMRNCVQTRCCAPCNVFVL